MKLILDTHVVLWWLDDPLLLSLDARQAISDPDHEVFVSAVVCWEIAIKRAISKLTAPPNLLDQLDRCGFQNLDVTSQHALQTETLPAIHRDPFDRMLIAQALIEGATLVTRDPAILAYGTPTIRA